MCNMTDMPVEEFVLEMEDGKAVRLKPQPFLDLHPAIII